MASEKRHFVDEPQQVVSKKKARRLRKQTEAQKRAYAYRHRMEQCAKAGDAAAAIAVFKEIRDEGVDLNQYIFQVVLNTCGNSSDCVDLKDDVLEIFGFMKQKLSKIDESTCSAVIKLCSRVKDFETCHRVIDELEEAKISPKLRTFSPLLLKYADLHNLEKSLWVYEKLKACEIEPTEAEFAALLRVCTANADAKRFYAILDDFIETVLQPSDSTWEVLKEWFNSDAAQVDGKRWKCSIGKVDEEGVCSISGNQLQSIELSAEAEQQLLYKIESLVRTDAKRIEQWDAYKQWLDANGPFDVIIDAANVGYFAQNYEGGGFSYRQIAMMVEHYKAQNKKVLIILHKRRTSDEQVPPEFRETMSKWKEANMMYNCLPGNNDDWYWLYAAVKLGGRTLMISNDEMRDHHFQMIHNKSFVRWKERHQVHYTIAGSRLRVQEPSKYSKRPQHVRSTWHFPSSVAESEDWLCCQLNFEST